MNTNTHYYLSASGSFNDIFDTPVSPENDKCRQLLASQTRQKEHRSMLDKKVN